MVAQHYRWDFIQLSTDPRPTPQTSEKVVDGSTLYCSDTSKLYVFCKDDWYERKPLGGGGGGTTYTAGDGIVIADDTISVDTDTIQEKLTAGTNISIDADNVISCTQPDFTGTDGTAVGVSGLVPAPVTTDAGKFLKADGTWDTAGGSGVIELTSADYNYPSGNPNRIALWLLDTGEYLVKQGTLCFFASGWSVSTGSYDVPVSITKDASFGITRVKYLNVATGYPDWYEYNIIISSGDMQAGDANGKLTGGLVFSTYNALDAENNQEGMLAPLSAFQGKVLNNKITPTTGASAPSTSTTGELGKIFIDTTNDTAYMCVKVSSGTYTWKQITV